MADDIIKITDHADAAEARLAGKFKGKPRIKGLIRSFGRETQELEDALTSFLDARKIRTAVGVQLDELGSLVGAERQGFDDEFFRVLIYVKIAENFSEGQPEPLKNAFKLMTNALTIQYINHGGASLSLISDGQLLGVPAAFVREQLERLVAAGVSIETLTIADQDEPFAFAGPNLGLGFSDMTGLVGGKFSGLI